MHGLYYIFTIYIYYTIYNIQYIYMDSNLIFRPNIYFGYWTFMWNKQLITKIILVRLQTNLFVMTNLVFNYVVTLWKSLQRHKNTRPWTLQTCTLCHWGMNNKGIDKQLKKAIKIFFLLSKIFWKQGCHRKNSLILIGSKVMF